MGASYCCSQQDDDDRKENQISVSFTTECPKIQPASLSLFRRKHEKNTDLITDVVSIKPMKKSFIKDECRDDFSENWHNTPTFMSQKEVDTEQEDSFIDDQNGADQFELDNHITTRGQESNRQFRNSLLKLQPDIVHARYSSEMTNRDSQNANANPYALSFASDGSKQRLKTQTPVSPQQQESEPFEGLQESKNGKKSKNLKSKRQKKVNKQFDTIQEQNSIDVEMVQQQIDKQTDEQVKQQEALRKQFMDQMQNDVLGSLQQTSWSQGITAQIIEPDEIYQATQSMRLYKELSVVKSRSSLKLLSPRGQKSISYALSQQVIVVYQDSKPIACGAFSITNEQIISEDNHQITYRAGDNQRAIVQYLMMDPKYYQTGKMAPPVIFNILLQSLEAIAWLHDCQWIQIRDDLIDKKIMTSCKYWFVEKSNLVLYSKNKAEGLLTLPKETRKIIKRVAP